MKTKEFEKALKNVGAHGVIELLLEEAERLALRGFERMMWFSLNHALVMAKNLDKDINARVNEVVGQLQKLPEISIRDLNAYRIHHHGYLVVNLLLSEWINKKINSAVEVRTEVISINGLNDESFLFQIDGGIFVASLLCQLKTSKRTGANRRPPIQRQWVSNRRF